MVQWHTKSKRKVSGGMRRTNRRCDKKKAWRGGESALTKIGKDEVEVKFGIGGTKKNRALAVKNANVKLENGKIVKAEIVSVKENNANRLYARANVVTKGALIVVKIDGKERIAKVTNRPGQSGNVNAIIQE